MTIGGVDVGGMDADEAKSAVHAQLLAPLGHSLKVAYDGESWKLHGKSLKIHADLDAAVEEALDASQDGGLPGRLVRYVTGGDLDERIPADITYSQPAVNRFVRNVAEEIDREPQDADVNAERRHARSRRPPSTAASCATTCSPSRSTPPSSTPTPTTRSPPGRTRPSRR